MSLICNWWGGQSGYTRTPDPSLVQAKIYSDVLKDEIGCVWENKLSMLMQSKSISSHSIYSTAKIVYSVITQRSTMTSELTFQKVSHHTIKDGQTDTSCSIAAETLSFQSAFSFSPRALAGTLPLGATRRAPTPRTCSSCLFFAIVSRTALSHNA